MLARFSRPFRIKVAIAIALVYSFCVLAPGSALAFVDPARAIDCLTDDLGATGVHEHPASAHVHADGVVHDHDHGDGTRKHSEDHSHAGGCCGLLCMSALAGDPGVTFGVFVRKIDGVPDSTDILFG
jgi:hypothetical protein